MYPQPDENRGSLLVGRLGISQGDQAPESAVSLLCSSRGAPLRFDPPGPCRSAHRRGKIGAIPLEEAHWEWAPPHVIWPENR